MTEEQKQNEDQKIVTVEAGSRPNDGKRLEDQTDIVSEVRSQKSEVPKHGFFHHKCKNCEKFKKEAEEFKTGWQRAVADYQNLKKETESRLAEWARFSEQRILEEFLPVYDNLKLAFGLRTADYGPEQQKWVDGIGHIMKQFEGVLKAHGIEEIKTVGEVFNPELHEAVGEEIADVGTGLDLSAHDGIILKEVEAGYKMKGKVIKAAKVVVSKSK